MMKRATFGKSANNKKIYQIIRKKYALYVRIKARSIEDEGKEVNNGPKQLAFQICEKGQTYQ
jgi:hypothetical protein